MENDLRAASTVLDAQSAVSWGAVTAGAVGAAALSLLLIAPCAIVHRSKTGSGLKADPNCTPRT
jgi:hypothetical protein